MRSRPTLGNYLGTESNWIPYALTQEEISLFLSRHNADMRLQVYLLTCDPPYGIIVYEGVGEFLVWQDQSHDCGDPAGLHITDVTFMPIVKAVNLAPYESHDESFIHNLIEEVKNISKGFIVILEELIPVGILIAALLLTRELRR